MKAESTASSNVMLRHHCSLICSRNKEKRDEKEIKEIKETRGLTITADPTTTARHLLSCHFSYVAVYTSVRIGFHDTKVAAEIFSILMMILSRENDVV